MTTSSEPNRSADWWENFFSSPDCLPLSFFPNERETQAEVDGVERLLGLRRDTPIADICCGAGRHLIPLVRRGYRLTGLDISPWLLARAQRAARSCGLPVQLVQGDARRLPFAAEAFEVTMNLFNSFGYCDTDEENEQILTEMARCLAPGGQFLLDTRNPQYQILFAPFRQTVHAANGTPLVMSCTYDREGHRLRATWKSSEGRVVHAASFRLYQLPELRALIRRIGLEEIGVYSGFGGEPFEGHERVVLYHARKPR